MVNMARGPGRDNKLRNIADIICEWSLSEISGVYDIDVPRRTSAAHGVAGATAGGGGGSGGGGGAAPSAAAAANKFVMTSGNNVVTMDYFKSK